MDDIRTAAMAWDGAFARRAAGMESAEVRDLLKLLDQPGIISFAGGIPDPALFPQEAIREAYAAVLGDPATAARALQYAPSEGFAPLRQWLAGHMGRLGVPCGVENIVITSGAQQALDYLGKLLLSPGDTALVPFPTFMGALQAFNAYEPRYDRLRPHGGNATAAHYAEAARAAGGRVTMAYCVPDFANPTGETLTEAQRLGLLDLAAELGIPLIEDAAYQALRFAGTPVAPIQALDVARMGGIEASRVIYCGTFSKTIAPGLRTGWICAAAPLIEKIVLAKQAGDLQNSTVNQMVMHRVVEACHDAQMAVLRPAYARRQAAMLAALSRHMPPGVSWSEPEGGMFVWVTLPPHVDGAALLARALAEERIAFVPGKPFFPHGDGSLNTLRLSYSRADEAEIEEGMRRLGRLLRRQTGRGTGADAA